MTPRERIVTDGVLIIGAGLAGLTAALHAAPRRALVLSPTALGKGAASAWAQGGMAAALDPADDPALHAADTLAAGAGLCEADAVEILTREGPSAVRALAALGAPFDRAPDGAFLQSLEAAHSRARVARVGGDGAGKAIMAAVIAAARRAHHIEIWEQARALALLTDGAGRVRGALVATPRGLVEVVASATVMASGGLGGLYAVTTDPAEVRGEGLALAALAGARIMDAEFVQFHPTAIDIGADPAPLATEALRGEGARLVNANGDPFMGRYDAAAELAPRDIVARGIALERKAGRGAFLDAREAVGAAFPHEFPFVFQACMAAGLDPRRDLVPVLPAAHYHMGGVETDLDGRSSLAGLFAAGECAATGAHGANRLASNSLLEAAVFGARAGAAAREASPARAIPIPRAEPLADLPATAIQDLRQAMSNEAGVVRDGAGLDALLTRIGDLEAAHGPALTLTTARLVTETALDRRESRGGHFRDDFPHAARRAEHSRVTLEAPAQALRGAA